MKAQILSYNYNSLIKTCLFMVLTLVSFNMTKANAMYVGNPDRPNMVWVSGHCHNGRCGEGYYIKFYKEPVEQSDLIWVGGQYDRCGNYVPGHYYARGWYRPNHYRVIGGPCGSC